MAAVDVIVEKFVALWGKKVVQRCFPWMFLIISAVGSVLKDWELVWHSYFSSSKNAVNVYFVKLSWGWTLLLLTPFILLSNSSFNRRASYLLRRMLSLVVATAVWFSCTQTFFTIEDWTGFCSETGSRETLKNEFTTKAACRRAGHHWQCTDISGHSFILTYSALFIVEEMKSIACLKKASLSAPTRMVLKLLYVALNLIVITWVWMFVCTSVYFHDLHDKLLGTTIGLLGWYLTYRGWYCYDCSPRLPPQGDPADKLA